MKKLLLFMVLSIGLFVYGQEGQLPDSILRSFNAKFPQVKSFDYWEMENEVYSVDFYRGGTMFTARFDKKGTWIETGEIISDSEVPSTLLAYAKKNYPGLPVCFSEKVEKSNKRFFRICLRNGEEDIYIASDLSGNNIQLTEK